MHANNAVLAACAVSWLSFRRIIDVPFATCVATLEDWQRTGPDGEQRIGPSLLRWRAGTPYQIRDLDGTPLTTAQGRAIVAQRYRVAEELRAQRRTSKGTSRRHQESPRAPTPARPHPTLRPPAKALDTA